MIDLGVVRFNENMEEDDHFHQEEEAAEAIRQCQTGLVPILAGAEFYVLLHFKTLLVSKNILP